MSAITKTAFVRRVTAAAPRLSAYAGGSDDVGRVGSLRDDCGSPAPPGLIPARRGQEGWTQGDDMADESFMSSTARDGWFLGPNAAEPPFQRVDRPSSLRGTN